MIRQDTSFSSGIIRRNGFTMLESVVSAGLLMVVMSFVVKMTYSVDSVWSDTGQQRVAIHELSNQLEQLVDLPETELSVKLKSLKVSDGISSTLPEPSLAGETIQDEFGVRIVLRLQWQRRHPGKPMEMTAWLTKAEPAVVQDSASIAPEPLR